MKKFIYLCFIFLICGCSPAEKNSYIPPLKFVNISNEIEINIDLGIGKGFWTVWTCDFTKDYIKINADYRS